MVNGCAFDSVTYVCGAFSVLGGGVVVGAVYPSRVIEDDCGVCDFLVDEGVGVLCHVVEC